MIAPITAVQDTLTGREPPRYYQITVAGERRAARLTRAADEITSHCSTHPQDRHDGSADFQVLNQAALLSTPVDQHACSPCCSARSPRSRCSSAASA